MYIKYINIHILICINIHILNIYVYLINFHVLFIYYLKLKYNSLFSDAIHKWSCNTTLIYKLQIYSNYNRVQMIINISKNNYDVHETIL